MKPQSLLPTWKPSAQSITKRTDLLHEFEFKYKPLDKLWKYRKAYVTQELVEKAHDEVFIQVLQIALMQNYSEAMQKYMINSDEEPLKPV